MSPAASPGPPDASASTAGISQIASTRRKHRAGLQRVQIACERCRSRKNKCDRKLPECSTCKASGVPCVVVDRLTNRQYARGHVEDLEAEVQRLNAQVEQLQLEASALKDELSRSANASDLASSSLQTPLSDGCHAIPHSPGDAASTANSNINVNIVSRDVTSNDRFIGDSSGLFFGNIVQSFLLEADYKGEQGPGGSNNLRLRVGERRDAASPSTCSASSTALPAIFPNRDAAQRLQSAFFTHRWPALPFLHRPAFLEQHFNPALTLKHAASDVSLFLTFMVFALGAIDLRRQDHPIGNQHLQFFNLATQHYLHGLLRADNIETVQGLLLVAQFSVNEHQSANAWLVAGQAVRTAIDIGLHRNRKPLSPSDTSMLTSEMRKRVFWSAYALDRNISIALGRPCAIRDSDIDIPLPQILTDEDLQGHDVERNILQQPIPSPLDTSTFVHIVKLRKLQSKIQELFYSADCSAVALHGADHHRNLVRAELDAWVTQAPRYARPTVVTFQSAEWFQIAYSHAILLLYRPSPASPVVDMDSLQICADSSISLISSYSSLYAKNKITYTWIALHSLFMASITMLYTIWVSPEIRRSTTKAVVKSNVLSCLALFEVMSGVWPLATRCYEIIDRLGSITVAKFDVTAATVEGPTPSTLSVVEAPDQHFGQIDAEFMDWFGTRESHLTSSLTALECVTDSGALPRDSTAEAGLETPTLNMSEGMDLFSSIMEGVFPQEFDTTIPMMMSAFGTDTY